ncbi:MAG: TIGR00299 family protein, partial [Deltaproteobacteria bacterium]
MITAYLDCFSGISGDMFIGALLDAGLGAEELKKSLDTLPLKGYHLRIKREKRHHISGTRF